MIGKSAYKVPNGKLLKVLLDFDGGKINSIKLTGDFFLYPEEAIGKIEAALAGKKFERDGLVGALEMVISGEKIELFGVSADAIVEGVLLARGGGA